MGRPNAHSDIVVAGERPLDPDEFKAELASHVSGRIGVNRDVLVFVHGFNTSFDEARLRAAQVVADSKFGGVPVLFTWPSKNQLFGYVSDKDSATASRDALQDLLTDIAATPGVGKIHVLAHSMGGWVAMEALRQEAFSGHRDLDGHLGDVMLASPTSISTSSPRRWPKSGPRKSPCSRRRTIARFPSRAPSPNPSAGRRDRSLNPADKAKIEELGAKVYDLSKYSDGFIDHGAYAVTPDVLHAIGAKWPRRGRARRIRFP